MRCEVWDDTDRDYKKWSVVAVLDLEPECGEDFCESCGDCLDCYGDCECCNWVMYVTQMKAEDFMEAVYE